MIYLVRHAHAGQKQTWSGPDRRRPLSSHGQQEAAGLLIQLHQEPITRIVSSPALRCQQTVWPLARQRRLAVEPLPCCWIPVLAMPCSAPTAN